MTSEEKNISLGERLLMLRNKNRMTQEALSERLNISRQSISKWELDKALPDLEKMIQLSDIYDVSMDYLIKGILPEANEEASVKPAMDILQGQNIIEGREGEFKENNNAETKDQDFLMVKKYIYMICTIMSGLLCLIIFTFSIKSILNDVSAHKNYNQEIVSVDKIYKQYTKAELSGVDEKGDFFSEVLWLDIPGVKEKDFIFGFKDSEQSDKVYFNYYLQTLLWPVIIGIIMLIFLIAFCIAWVGTKTKN